MLWDSTSLTILLAVAHLTLYVFTLWITRYPEVTIFHLFLATQLVAFVIRPLLGAYEGGYTLYMKDRWDAYNLGLSYQLVATLFYVMGYSLVYILYHRKYYKSKYMIPIILPSIRPLLKGALISFALGLVALGLIHFLSNGDWLPNARNQALTSVVPFGKILFPLSIIPLSTVVPLALLCFWSGRGFISRFLASF